MSNEKLEIKNGLNNSNENFEVNDCFVSDENYHKILLALSNNGFNFLQYGAVLAQFGEKGFTGDASSLLTLVKEGEKVKLLKLAYGEFSHETFSSNPKTYPESALKLQTLKIPMFVINQENSYFKMEKLLKNLNGDVVEYLKK